MEERSETTVQKERKEIAPWAVDKVEGEFGDLQKFDEDHETSLSSPLGIPMVYDGLNPPIAMTSVYLRHGGSHQPQGVQRSSFSYAASGNPNFQIVESQLCNLYSAEKAVIFSSGMAAISAALWSCVSWGKRRDSSPTLVVSDQLYSDDSRLLEMITMLSGATVVSVDVTDAASFARVVAKHKERLCAFFLESCSNPAGKVPDLNLLVSLLKKDVPDGIVVVDNTWFNGYLFNPLNHGADLVLESATKYYNSGICVQGFCAWKDPPHPRNKKNKKKTPQQMISGHFSRNIRSWRRLNGAVPSPFDCWLASNSIPTMPLRLERSATQALEIARFLESLPCVSRVLYPLLRSHPSYEMTAEYLGRDQPERAFPLGPSIVYFHLPMKKAEYISMATRFGDEAVIKYATSYGKPHAQLDPYPDEDVSTLYDKNTGGVEGTWIRLALGYGVTTRDVKAELMTMFATSTPLVETIPGTMIKGATEASVPVASLFVGDILALQVKTPTSMLKRRFVFMRVTSQRLKEAYTRTQSASKKGKNAGQAETLCIDVGVPSTSRLVRCVKFIQTGARNPDVVDLKGDKDHEERGT